MAVKTITALIAAALVAFAMPTHAQATFAEVSALEVPVTAEDITDRPYEVVGEITTEVRKTMILSPSPSQEKVYRELWERAEKMGADAVIHAEYGDSRRTMMSWGSRRAKGVAVRFIEATAGQPASIAAN